MNALILQIVGFLLILSLLVIFNSKKHVWNKETKIYSKLLVINFIFIVIGILTFIVAKLTNNLTFIAIFQKLYMSILLILNYLSIKYCVLLFDLKLGFNNYIAKPIQLSILHNVIDSIK